MSIIDKAREAGRDEAGQAIVELAVLLPVLLILLTLVIDVGRYMLLQSGLDSAADSIARAVEENPDLAAHPDEATALVEANYPQYKDSVSVSIAAPVPSSREVDYIIYVNGNQRPWKSNVSMEQYGVTVEYVGEWLSPVMMAASSVTQNDGRFGVLAQSVATVDTTLDTWGEES